MSLLNNIDFNKENEAMGGNSQEATLIEGTYVYGRVVGYVELGTSVAKDKFPSKNQAMMTVELFGKTKGTKSIILNLGQDKRCGYQVAFGGLNFSGNYSHIAQMAEANAPFMGTVGKNFGGTVSITAYSAPGKFNSEGQFEPVVVPDVTESTQLLMLSDPTPEMFASVKSKLAKTIMVQAKTYPGSLLEERFGAQLLIDTKKKDEAAPAVVPVTTPQAAPEAAEAPIAVEAVQSPQVEVPVAPTPSTEDEDLFGF